MLSFFLDVHHFFLAHLADLEISDVSVDVFFSDFMQQKALKWTIKWLYAMAVEFDEIHGGLNSFVTAEYPGHWAMTSRKHLANRW